MKGIIKTLSDGELMAIAKEFNESHDLTNILRQLNSKSNDGIFHTINRETFSKIIIGELVERLMYKEEIPTI